MIRLTVHRPNTVGLVHTVDYDRYADCEDWIERKCESLADRGWELSELPGSSSHAGAIEATHDPILVAAPIACAVNRSEREDRRRAYWEVA